MSEEQFKLLAEEKRGVGGYVVNMLVSELASEYARIHQAGFSAGQAAELVGHGDPCYYCGKPCNNLAGNPDLWALRFCHADDPGVTKSHHTGCVRQRLRTADAPDLAEIRARCEAATKGPMQVTFWPLPVPRYAICLDDQPPHSSVPGKAICGGIVSKEDAELFANARADIPKLLDLIAELHAELEAKNG